MCEYLGAEAVRAHEARIEALSQMFENIELQSILCKEMSAAMQEFDSRIFTHRFYHEAPNDIFELVFPHLSGVDKNGRGKGGLNVMRLVSKRCMQVVESVATRLTGWHDTINDGALSSFHISALKRCTRIEQITCFFTLQSLEGCPDGLKSLYVASGGSLQSLEPLSAFKELETVVIQNARLISDLSPLSSCTRLKKLFLHASIVCDLTHLPALIEDLCLLYTPIKDISVLSQYKKLRMLNIGGNRVIEDLSPPCQCPDLEELVVSDLPLIKDLSFLEKGFTKLRVLSIRHLPVNDFSPLAKLQSLEELDCWGIPLSTSLLPLARCDKLKKLMCSGECMDYNELTQKRPEMEIGPN